MQLRACALLTVTVTFFMALGATEIDLGGGRR
jgi:hypothetical protein